jgi:hypothetical protein
MPVEGSSPMRVELYLARGAERPAIQIACAGTLVADDIAELAALGLAQPPWVGREIVGLIDFAGFHVPPGTRRGVMPDRAAAAFALAMDDLAPLVLGELARLDAERDEAVDRNVVRELRRALRGIERRLPHLDLPSVATTSGPRGNAAGGATAAPEPEESSDDDDADVTLFAPGPLHAVRIVPPRIELAPGRTRRLRAIATDQDGQRIDDAKLAWSLETESDLSLDERVLSAGAKARIGDEATVRVVARKGARSAEASASVHIVEDTDSGASLGIPEPVLVSDADGGWRSRMSGNRWEVNDAHADYRAMRAEARQRLRYLVSLLGKEIVLRSTGRAELGPLLESLVEILVLAERNLARRPS